MQISADVSLSMLAMVWPDYSIFVTTGDEWQAWPKAAPTDVLLTSDTPDGLNRAIREDFESRYPMAAHFEARIPRT